MSERDLISQSADYRDDVHAANLEYNRRFSYSGVFDQNLQRGSADSTEKNSTNAFSLPTLPFCKVPLIKLIHLGECVFLEITRIAPLAGEAIRIVRHREWRIH